MMTAILKKAEPIPSRRRKTVASPKKRFLKQMLPQLRDEAGRYSTPLLSELVDAVENDAIDYDGMLNRLMLIYKETRSVKIYTLLYQLSHKHFLSKIFLCIKRYHCLADPHDILQDVFLSIYRYPGGFQERNKHSFRNWSQTIIRNAVFKQMNYKEGVPSTCELEIDPTDPKSYQSPLTKVIKKEERKRFGQLYCLTLMLYQHVYNTTLNKREKTALHKVEVQRKSYKAAAAAMGIKVENFKMIVCRARKKIVRNAVSMSFNTSRGAVEAAG